MPEAIVLADQRPFCQRILEAIAPYIPRKPAGLEVLGVDVVYGSFVVNAMIVNGYCLLITCRGALIGPQHNITNAHIIPAAVPTKEQAQEMIHISTSRLREAKAAQSQLPQAPGGLDGRAN